LTCKCETAGDELDDMGVDPRDRFAQRLDLPIAGSFAADMRPLGERFIGTEDGLRVVSQSMHASVIDWP